MSEDDTDGSPEGHIIPYDPAHIVEIQVGDLTAPVAAGIEMSKLFLAAADIVKDLKYDIRKDNDSGRMILPPDLLPWMKELRMLLDRINAMTSGIEEKAALKKMDIAGKIFSEYMKSLDPQEKIQVIRALKSNGTV